MIVDTLDNLSSYVSLNPLFQDVVDFLKANDLNKLEDGKHFIKGDDLFVNIEVAPGKTKTEARLESHRRMIDIQIPLSAAETYGYKPLSELSESQYNEKDDLTFYEEPAEVYLTRKPGEMVVFFPQDAHAPCISAAPVRKAIFKVKA